MGPTIESLDLTNAGPDQRVKNRKVVMDDTTRFARRRISVGHTMAEINIKKYLRSVLLRAESQLKPLSKLKELTAQNE